MFTIRSIRRLMAVLVLVSLSAMALPAAPNDAIWSGEMDSAIRSLNTRLQSVPNDAESNHQLSKIYYNLKMWDRAVQYGERAVELSPDNSDFWMWLGRAYGEKADNANFAAAFGLARKAHNAFEKAAALNPTNIPALTDLAEYYAEAPGIVGGGTEKAKQVATKLAPLDEAKSHWVYARIDEKNKDFEGAERELREAIRSSGNDGAYWLNLAYLYGNRKQWNEMDLAINKGLNSPKKPVEALYNAASDYNRVGRNLPEAVRMLRKYIAGGAQNDEAPLFQAHYLLGQVLEKLGDKAGALAEYRSAAALASGYAPAADALKRVSGN